MAGHVAHIDGAQELGWIVDAMPAEDVHRPQQPRLLADRVGSLARSHPEGMRAAIEGNPDHAGARRAGLRGTGRRQPMNPGTG